MFFPYRTLLSLLLLFPVTSQADILQAFPNVLQGRVIGVTDGDTVTLLDASKTQYKIRLSGIDAPEKSQPFGNRSKQSLSDLAYNRVITVEWSKKDRYGRTVGKLVAHDGKDINLEQIRRGLAWHYKAYQREQSPEDRVRYAKAEEAARAQGVGLWRDAQQVPPWEYRKMKRKGR